MPPSDVFPAPALSGRRAKNAENPDYTEADNAQVNIETAVVCLEQG